MEWMLDLHSAFAAFALIVLTLGGLYSGIVAPLGNYVFKMRFFREGYAHKSRFLTICLSIVMGVGIPTAFLVYYAVDGGFHDPDPKAFFRYVWRFCDYWRSYQNFRVDGLLFCYIYFFLCFGLVLNSAFGIFSRWKPLPEPETEPASERHLFLIVAHNSSDKLRETVLAIFNHVAPHQVFVADNGSSSEEIKATDEMCFQLSLDYYASRGLEFSSQINVSHIQYGNKTLAQFHAVHSLHSRYHEGKSPIDIITILDDDVLVPKNWPSKSIEAQFDDPSKIVLGYPLCAENNSATLMATLQDCEYLSGNVGRYVQSMLGTQLFASGAIATWRLDQLKEVLSRHCTIFNGEDLEMGYLVHKLSGRDGAKLGTEHPTRIGYVRDCVVPTIVPYCAFHWYDVLPNPIKKKLRPTPCKCEEHSFLNQRLRSWDPAGHMFLVKWIKVLFSPGGRSYSPKWFVRVICMWKIISALRELSQIVGIFVSFGQLRTLESFKSLMVFYADSIVISWSVIVFYSLFQSHSCGRLGMSWRPDIIVWYPILYEIPYTLIIRTITCLYTIFYYLIVQRFPDDVRTQLEKDGEKSKEILTSQLKEFSIADLERAHLKRSSSEELLIANK
ncbi:hypothetical protein K493DRAFT_308677 [Basidiobolus meristosporus CBS 931.73]|uniref:Uncharacterized protein n=1 Tax=Basidiobolus meristosporus CBS 931.73 TaxID=1314790 RepID=A0A1Y1WYP5_9FUNG|nr:hypothetical protein K493DRAFT_308677 [Basidiobolus meristosporus CBS 931.73]|eukprot:ORX78552.1 hypothetical protein K493DRAFT_308677 [Basidiobolus meristosporus CBS 931.73]